MAELKKIPGREVEPNANAARQALNSVKVPDNKSASKDPKAKDIVDKVIKCYNDTIACDKEIANVAVTSAIAQIRSLLNQLSKESLQPALEEIKDEVSSTSLKNIIGNVLMSQIAGLFDDDAKKEDIEELKDWIQHTFSDALNKNEGQQQLTPEELKKQLDESMPDFGSLDEPISDAGPVEDDVVEGDYQDSTPAKNFATLQDFVNTQFDVLNEKLKNVPGQSGILSRISASIGNGFSRVFSGVGKLTKGVMGGIGSIAKKTLGVFSVVGTVAAGIKGIGSKIGGAIASPFKKVGGFIKSLNPFHKSAERAEAKKQSAKEKIFNFMAKVLEKIWKLIEPFVEKVAFFMGLITKFVIIPIAIIMAKILLVVAAIIAIGVAAYLAYKWVKEKIASFWKYITSGEMWKDIKVKLLEWWGWLKDFGKWLWDLTVKAVKYIFCDMWVDLGKWLWAQITKFWNWIYGKFIGPYIVEPIKKVISLVKTIWEEKIQPVIQPFIDSLMNLYQKIKQAFSSWDTNKSIWENLKNIGGIIVDSVKQWWETSPFKEFYDKHLNPIIQSLGNLVTRIKAIWANFKWDENKSFFENLKCIGSIMIDSIKQWWEDPENPIKKIYNKYVRPIIDKVQEKLQPFIDKAKQIINDLGNMIWDLKITKIRPFGFLVGKTMKLSDEEADRYENITKFENKIADASKKNVKIDKEITDLESKLKTGDYGRSWTGFKKSREDIEKELLAKKQERFENDAEAILAQDQLEKNKAKDLAKQQVSGAMTPIDSLNAMKADTNVKLQKEGQAMSQKMQEKEEKQQKFDAAQYDMMSQVNPGLKALNEKVDELKKDKPVIAVPTPVSQPERSATMNASTSFSFITAY